jgi:cobalt-zinc-cadmium efflux system membrane fusion protein
MNVTIVGRGILFALSIAAGLMGAGCGKDEDKKATTENNTKKPTAGNNTKKPTAENDAQKSGDHSGWWCAEHGIPEYLCSMCSDKVAAESKKNGDWCKEHDRAKSQCFKCEPKRKEKFAAMYRAKYGKEPPPIEEK